MKSTFITPIFLALALPLFSQTWLAEGQTWEYDATGGWDPAMYGKMVMRVEGDTTIEGIACKRVLNYQPDGSLETNYAYQDQGRVYCYDMYLETFVKVYDFSLVPGDTVHFQGDRKYVIDSVGTASIAGTERKFQIVSLSGNSLDEGTYLIAEGLGLLSRTETFNPIYDCIYFFIQYPFCMEAVDGRSYRFRCFTEGDLVYDPLGLCTLSSAESLHLPKLNIFPNPAQSQFTLQYEGNSNEYGLLRVFDATGRMILEAPKILPATVSVEGWPAGSYQVLFFGEKLTVSGRVMVP